MAVAERPYVDRPVTDLVAAARAADIAADEWGLARPVLLRRGMNALFESGPVVIRVGNTTAPAELGHALAAMLLGHGVATTRPVPGLAGSFLDFAVSSWDRVPVVDEPVDWEVVGDAVRRVHCLDSTLVPIGYPVPDPRRFPWWDFDSLLRELADEIDDQALAGLDQAVTTHLPVLDAMSADAVLCHGDVHPGNVLASSTGPLLIDWDLMCRANPAWDHAMLTTYAERWGGSADVYVAFAAGYGRSFAGDRLTVSVGTLRNVAATLMRVRVGRNESAARSEAERRLRYWRGDPDAPVWRAQ